MTQKGRKTKPTNQPAEACVMDSGFFWQWILLVFYENGDRIFVKLLFPNKQVGFLFLLEYEILLMSHYDPPTPT